MKDERRIGMLFDRTASLRSAIARHPLYENVKSPEGLRIFMEHHVFAVWDFMSLLKGLQRSLTCVEIPWRPVSHPAVRRLINEFVLEEESDCIDGEPIGHFELYLRAMREVGADTSTIEQLVSLVADGCEIEAAFSKAGVPQAAVAFNRATLRSIDLSRPHVIAAAYTCGRENVVPSMFSGLVGQLERRRAEYETLLTYLECHCQLDAEKHGPQAIEMLERLCGDDAQRWSEAEQAAVDALAARLAFWDAIAMAIGQHAARPLDLEVA